MSIHFESSEIFPLSLWMFIISSYPKPYTTRRGQTVTVRLFKSFQKQLMLHYTAPHRQMAVITSVTIKFRVHKLNIILLYNMWLILYLSRLLCLVGIVFFMFNLKRFSDKLLGWMMYFTIKLWLNLFFLFCCSISNFKLEKPLHYNLELNTMLLFYI